MTLNPFQYSPNFPTHISVGVIGINDKNEILCHHWATAPSRHVDWGELYHLCRETLEPNESLETAVHRGLMEEFGATGEILGYIGPTITRFRSERLSAEVEKTTLFFLVKITGLDPDKRTPNDPDGDSTPEWHTAEFLIERMKEQGQRTGRSDNNDSAILELFLQHYA